MGVAWLDSPGGCGPRGVGGSEGTGKTQVRPGSGLRAYHGLPWPDGHPMTLPRGSKSLPGLRRWPSRRNAGAARKMNLPLDAVLFNASPDDPCTGVDLDDPAAIESLDAFLEISASLPLVFIDTLTNSTSRDLCRQNDVKLLRFLPCKRLHRCRQIAISLAAASPRGRARPGRAHQGPDADVDPPRTS